MIFPILQFCVFYVGVNVNAILLAFQRYDALTGAMTWDPISTIPTAFRTLSNQPGYMWRNSAFIYVFTLAVSTPLSLLLSYYIYKKLFASNLFRVLLFLPSIISGVVLVAIFVFFAERAIPQIMSIGFNKQMSGLIEDSNTQFMTILLFGLWTGFGGGILMYSNAMCAISPDVVEAAHVEGATGIREFWHITLPLIYPTLSTLLMLGVGGLFLSDMGLYVYFRGNARPELHTYSYVLYLQTLGAQTNGDYAVLSAIGLLMTVVIAPLTFLVRWLLRKYGPSTD
jgi:ABC-type sugar transport system permease subunit